MNEKVLRRRLADAIARAEKEREKAERERHPATRDVQKGRADMGRDVLKWMDEEAKT